MSSETEQWPEKSRECGVCGAPAAFPTSTRWGIRHDCQNRDCRAVAWGTGPFKPIPEWKKERSR